MPFGSYDQENRIFDELKRQIISIVVVLAEDQRMLGAGQVAIFPFSIQNII